MIEGILLGGLKLLGICLLWGSIPNPIKRIAYRIRLFTEITATVVSYLTIAAMTSSLGGAIGSAIVGVGVSLGLRWSDPRRRINDRRGIQGNNGGYSREASVQNSNR